MARFSVPNKTYIQGDDSKYATAFDSVERALNAVADQTNTDLTGAQQAAPPAISNINVVEAGGIHDVQINDNSPAYAGLNYRIHYSQDQDFSNFHTIDLKTSQNHRINLGAGKYYWAADSYYHAATTSPMAYHGGSSPVAVGSGTYPGPAMQSRQAFTGKFRNSETPPIRQ